MTSIFQSWQSVGNVRTDFGFGALRKRSASFDDLELLLICSAGALKRREIGGLVAELSRSNRLTIEGSITPNPSKDQLDEILARLGGKRFDLICAVGGGSVIDAAKVISVGLSGDEIRTSDLLGDAQNKKLVKTRLIAVPTTAGTGAEITPFATIWDDVEKKKLSYATPLIVPEEAILDPELTLTVPHATRLDCALDSLSHSLESLWNKNANSASRTLSLRAIDLMLETIPAIVDREEDEQVYESQLLASHFAGLAISSSRTAIAHAISYPLTARFSVPHGLACSFTLGAILRRSQDQLGQDLGPRRLAQLNQTFTATNCAPRILEYVSRLEVLSLIDEMFTPERADNFIHPLDVEDVRDILKESLM